MATHNTQRSAAANILRERGNERKKRREGERERVERERGK